MRCPECGATNPADAAWCGQCYADLTQPAAPRAPSPAVPADASPAEPTEASPAESTAAPAAEGFRRRGETVEWSCPACGQWTAVDSLHCRVCATPLSARFEQPADPGEQPWSAALVLTAVLPGTGHIAVAHYGQGLARLVLFVVWLAGALTLTRAGGGAGWAAAPLYLGAGVLWAGSLADVAALRTGGRELLGGRTLLWLVVGVLGLSALGVLGAAVQAPGVG